jgi:hypothetical protein
VVHHFKTQRHAVGQRLHRISLLTCSLHNWCEAQNWEYWRFSNRRDKNSLGTLFSPDSCLLFLLWALPFQVLIHKTKTTPRLLAVWFGGLGV